MFRGQAQRLLRNSRYRIESGEIGLLVNSVGFDLVGSDLGSDVESALETALVSGAVFLHGTNPLQIFRKELRASIRDIELHPRGQLLQKFLLNGPYEDTGEIPMELAGRRLSDAEYASAITFIFSYMVNSFKGAVAELLAARACSDLLRQLQQHRELPANALLYIGDVVGVHRPKGKGVLKGADLYVLFEERDLNVASSLTVAGVVEVKSYIQSKRRLHRQLSQHVRRAKLGLRVNGVDYTAERVHLGYGSDSRIIRIAVVPSSWKLSRSFRYKDSESGRSLHVDWCEPPLETDEIVRTGDNEWRITLRWSKEALAEAGYKMTFWFMEQIGEVIYAQFVPKGWGEMSPAEAGRNAAKMMLYYAILRSRTAREKQRAIALYNCYGYGYSLGMNYKNKNGRREMLWPEDLEQILKAGKTEDGCVLS